MWRWKRLAGSLRQSTQRLCWDAKRGLLADTARRNSFSQHAQVLAVLAGLWPARRSARVLQRALADSSVQGPGTLYFRYYLAQALRQAGLVAELYHLLGLWDQVLEGTGLSTWPESDGDARSDCHGWSVTPPLEFLQGILGVCPDPSADGMSRLILDPFPGPLQQARGLVPTPHGPVRIAWKRADPHLQITLDSPVPLHVAALDREVRAGRRRLVLPLRAAPAVA